MYSKLEERVGVVTEDIVMRGSDRDPAHAVALFMVLREVSETEARMGVFSMGPTATDQLRAELDGRRVVECTG